MTQQNNTFNNMDALQAERLIELEIRRGILARAINIQDGEIFQGVEDFLIFRSGSRVGVAVPTEMYINIHSVNIGRRFCIDGVRSLLRAGGNYITLTVDKNAFDLSNPLNQTIFSSQMYLFVNRNNGNRESLLADPWKWAAQVVEVSGNEAEETRPYPYIAELCLVQALYQAGLMTDIAAQYRGPEGGIHDYELPTMSLEAKSHLHTSKLENDDELVISSINQLANTDNKPLYVVFFKMEETGNLSLKNCVEALDNQRQVILEKLSKKNFVEGDFAWQMEYHLLGQPQVYEITGDFPRIIPDQFRNGQAPSEITKLIYHVSLHNRPSCSLNSFIETFRAGQTPQFTI